MSPPLVIAQEAGRKARLFIYLMAEYQKTRASPDKAQQKINPDANC